MYIYFLWVIHNLHTVILTKLIKYLLKLVQNIWDNLHDNTWANITTAYYTHRFKSNTHETYTNTAKSKQRYPATCIATLLACSLLSLLSGPGRERSTVLRSVSKLFPDYTASDPRRFYSLTSCSLASVTRVWAGQPRFDFQHWQEIFSFSWHLDCIWGPPRQLSNGY
jgi:hypothetical protein